MKNILISGSLAYDNIMFYDGVFKDSLIAESLDHLSVSYLASSRELYFGGCSGNIAYSLSLLGEKPFIFAAAGTDFAEYEAWLKKNKVSLDYIARSEKFQTAAAFILNDSKQSQITIFSPSAMQDMDLAMTFDDVNTEELDFAIVAPDVPERMKAVASECVRYAIPYLFDPGQAMSALSIEDLQFFVESAQGVILNEYEKKLVEEIMGMKIEKVAEKCSFLIETLGEGGAKVYENGKSYVVETVPEPNPVEVTGCGDVFRAGFVHGLVNDLPLDECCRLGNKAASYAIKKLGTQNHSFTIEDLRSNSDS